MLAADLGALMREPVLVPADTPLPTDPMPAVLAAGHALADGFRDHGQAFLAVLLDALERKVLHGGSYKAAWLQSLWTALAGWCEGGDYTKPLDEKLARLTPQALQVKTNKAHVGNTPESPLCAQIDTYLQAASGCDAAGRCGGGRARPRIRSRPAGRCRSARTAAIPACCPRAPCWSFPAAPAV